jgi:hypothetical protein
MIRLGLSRSWYCFLLLLQYFTREKPPAAAHSAGFPAQPNSAIYYPTYAPSTCTPWWIQWNKFGNVNVIICLSRFAKLNWDKPYTTCTNKNNRSNCNRLVQLQPILNSCIRLLRVFTAIINAFHPPMTENESRLPLGHEQTTLALQVR